MPQLGESVREGTIAKWLVKPGDPIVQFEPMLEVDTDKVSAEIPAPVTGTVRELLVKEGETVSTGTEIAVIDLGVTDGASATDPALPRAAAAGRPSDGATRVPPAERPAGGPAPRPAPTSYYSAAVSQLARANNLDLATVAGTGLDGRVTKRDVQRALDSRATVTPSGQTPPVARPLPAAALEGDEVVPLSRMRRLIAENVARSKATIPHAWQTQEVNMTGVVASRAAMKERFAQEHGFSLSYLPYVIAAAAAGLRAHPEVNATFNATDIVVHHRINIGISVGLENGVLVPVIREVDRLSLTGIARAVNDLATRARTGKLTADDLAGGTFTVNNTGTFGTLFSYSVINPGQAGILTMEAIVERPVGVDGGIGLRPMMYLCFSLDHRVLDGLAAARFLSTCRAWLEAVTVETPLT